MTEQEKRMMKELLWTLCEELNNNAGWMFDGRTVQLAKVDESCCELCISFREGTEFVLTGMVRLTKVPVVDNPPCVCSLNDGEPHYHISLFDVVPVNVWKDAMKDYLLKNVGGPVVQADLEKLTTEPLGASMGSKPASEG